MQGRTLRSGYTTGACATATASAAAVLLLGGEELAQVTLELPRGESVVFAISAIKRLQNGRVRADTIKDAGDDPDVTHKATVFCELARRPQPGIAFYAAAGVGTVTRDGLTVGVGEPAINPVPRMMIRQHLQKLADQYGYRGGFDVHIGVEDGERLALRTLNGRLGIVGGLSILGTTGIVRPYSCSAFIASIHQSINVAHANGIAEIAASTGSTSERYIQQRLGLPDMALVEMWDFAGAVLKHLRQVPMKKLSICGGFGKMSKLAAGHQSLHSKDASIDFAFLGTVAAGLGASPAIVERMTAANTSIEALQICTAANIALATEIARLARQQALKVARHRCAIDIYCIDRAGHLVGSTV